MFKKNTWRGLRFISFGFLLGISASASASITSDCLNQSYQPNWAQGCAGLANSQIYVCTNVSGWDEELEGISGPLIATCANAGDVSDPPPDGVNSWACAASVSSPINANSTPTQIATAAQYDLQCGSWDIIGVSSPANSNILATGNLMNSGGYIVGPISTNPYGQIICTPVTPTGNFPQCLSLDLLVSSVEISQSGPTVNPNDNHFQVAPGTPVQVNVPVSGSGFNSPETRSTTVTLQAGSQLLKSPNISLADIQSGAVSSVTFNVTFDPSLAGTTQEITATIDPKNALNEANFTNNTASVNVDIVPQYQLIAMVNGVPIPNSGGSLQLQPTIKACGTGAYAIPPAPTQVPVQIQCVNAAKPSQPISGCQFLLDLSLGSDNGGHNHNLNDDTRPFVLDTAPANFPMGRFLSVETNGGSLIYSPPEVSGDVILEITGTDPNGNQINGPSYTFQVLSSLSLIDLNGTGATNNNPGISIITASHSGEGSFGTSTMQTKVSAMVARYYQLGDEAGFTNLDSIESQAATMGEGGLFDANWNGNIYPSFLTPWASPHCGHRDGQSIDLSINQLDADEQGWLQQAAKYAKFVFIAPGERPGDTGATHWHATLNLTQ